MTTEQLRSRPLKSVAFDLSSWHASPACNRIFVSGIGGIGVKIACTTHGILCDVEAIGQRIPPADSFIRGLP